METVTLSRELDLPAEDVRAAVRDVGPFMEAAGFTEVTVDDDDVSIRNTVGLLTIELDLSVVDDPDTLLTYEQDDGIFTEMVTRYDLEESETGVTITGETDFELDVSVVGPILDGTVIKRQRRKELRSQFDYLESLEQPVSTA